MPPLRFQGRSRGNSVAKHWPLNLNASRVTVAGGQDAQADRRVNEFARGSRAAVTGGDTAASPPRWAAAIRRTTDHLVNDLGGGLAAFAGVLGWYWI